MQSVTVDSRAALRVRALRPADWPAVRAIYAAGIATGDATLETEVPSWQSWDAAHLPGGRLLAVGPGPDGRETALGWAALSPVSTRCVYGGVAEVSVYVAADAQRRGVGRALLGELVAASERAGIWTLQAGILPENQASVALHHSCGFRTVGVRERIGQLRGRWRDVLLLERRSGVVGV